MKTTTSTSTDFFSIKSLVLLTISVLALFYLVACYDAPTESHGFTGIAGDHIGDDYVYYPSYEVYYVASRHEYVYYDSTTSAWVRTTAPTQVWAKDINGAPYVKMTFHDSPELHHVDVVREYPHNWQPPEAVPGVPARTTNDDVRDGTRAPDDKTNH